MNGCGADATAFLSPTVPMMTFSLLDMSPKGARRVVIIVTKVV